MVPVLAPAKVNLFLRINGKSKTGLHNIDSIVVFCQFGDQITVTPAQKDSFLITGPFAANMKNTPNNRNLVILARDAFRAAGGICGPIAITLEKNIPIGAGLGGGSTDAAAQLRAMNKIANTPLNHEQLFSIAANLGSDVPVCLAASPHRIKGTGNVIHPIKNMIAGALLLVNPLVALSTADVFKKLLPIKHAPLKTIPYFDAISLCEFGNDLLPAAVELVPEIKELLLRLRQAPSCRAAQMSGSGASCFGVFDNLDAATKASFSFEKAGIWAIPTLLNQ